MSTKGDNEEDNSINDDFIAKVLIIVTIIVTMSTRKKPEILSSNKTIKPTKHNINDLVTSTASEMMQPEYKKGRIDRSCMFFGIADQSSKLFIKNPNYINVKWCGVESGYTLIKSATKMIQMACRLLMA